MNELYEPEANALEWGRVRFFSSPVAQKSMRRGGFAAALTVCLLTVLISPGMAQPQRTLIVFAASSLINVFEDIASEFEAANPGVDVLFSFGGSSVIAAQLVEGATADVFASANDAQMALVREASRIAGEPVIFAGNRLALIVPADNPAGIAAIRDLAEPHVMLVAAMPGVPVRSYMDMMFARLAADPEYGDAFRRAALANVVSEEQNPRQVVAKIALGEGDAGIVYFSDAASSLNNQVIAIPIPDEFNPIATYPIAAINDSIQPELAAAFIDFVLSEAGQAALIRWNFIPASSPELARCGQSPKS